jgi:hypothetical protein
MGSGAPASGSTHTFVALHVSGGSQVALVSQPHVPVMIAHFGPAGLVAHPSESPSGHSAQSPRRLVRGAHPNVVQTYDVGEEDGRYYLPMEYLEGQSLAAVLRNTRRSTVSCTDYANIVDFFIQFQPNIVILLTGAEGASQIVLPLEQRWPTGVAQPWYVVSHGARTRSLEVAKANDEIRRRVRGTVREPPTRSSMRSASRSAVRTRRPRTSTGWRRPTTPLGKSSSGRSPATEGPAASDQ